MHQGKPAVYVQKGANFELRPIEVGKRNDTDMVVSEGSQGRRDRGPGESDRGREEGQEAVGPQ